jgi:hypothetical protein
MSILDLPMLREKRTATTDLNSDRILIDGESLRNCAKNILNDKLRYDELLLGLPDHIHNRKSVSVSVSF